MGSHNLPT